MPVPASPAVWWGSLIWLVAVAAASFAVAWATGSRLHIRRTPYVAILTVVTGALSVGYLAWLGVGFTDVLTTRWGWGILAGAAIGMVLMWGAMHQPADRPLHGRELARALAWEGVVYGTAEGVLLSALPPFITWQLVHSLGWSGTGGAIARWALPLLATAAVIIVHHLGYWNCRNRILVPITLACGALGAGFLLTASWIAPALGHILVHFGLNIHGSAMPPVERPAETPPTERPTLVKAA